MSQTASEFERWLTDARAGSNDALGRALETCRHFLLHIADKQFDIDLRAKEGVSDLVQETYLEAQRDFSQFHGTSEGELLAWLRQILLHNLANFQRRYHGSDKRQVSREVALKNGDSSATEGVEPAAATTSPSHLAIASEEAESVRNALLRLPTDCRDVIALRHQEQKTFEEIARMMGRSTSGVRLLWLRGIELLNEELGAPP